MIDRIQSLAGCAPEFIRGDVQNSAHLDSALGARHFDGVIHLAGLKSVGESVGDPLSYFKVNFGGALSVLSIMAKHGIKNFVFSSTAAVYGVAGQLPIPESVTAAPANPYGQSKLMVEQALLALYQCDPSWRIAALRYFNPVGAHKSGCMGEDPSNPPSNLVPICIDAALGRRDSVPVYGTDYSTQDGTGVRDFIHVMDLADGHISALDFLEAGGQGCCHVVNLGTGRGASVLQVIEAVERASGVTLRRNFQARRAGDVGASYADAGMAMNLFGWQALRGLDEMCQDAWLWRKRNPAGYATSTSSTGH